MNKLQKRQVKTSPANYNETILNLERAKLYLRESNSDQDDVIQDLINAGIQFMESGLDFSIDTSSLIYQYYDEFPSDGVLFIWHRFILTNDLVVQYWDGANFTAVDAENYRIDDSSVPARVFLTSEGEWPSGSDDLGNKLRVGFKVNVSHPFYSDLKAAVFAYVAWKYENPEGMTDIPSGITLFLDRYRMRS